MFNAKTLRFFWFLFFGILIILLTVTATYSLNGSEEAIEEAKVTLASSYENVLKAEMMGGDVSDLFINLNFAADDLTKSVNFNRIGDFDNSSRLANLSIGIGKEITENASQLINNTKRTNDNRFSNTLSLSLLEVFIVILIGYLIWKVINVRHNKSILGQETGDVLH
jgi:hypothetical protein